jgi:tryptophan synthase alpha chain
LVVFVSAGAPDLDTTAELLRILAENGVDIVELGAPFSDPMADGPTIQAASLEALSRGVTLRDLLRLAGEFRKTSQTPLVLFSYYNVLFRYGVPHLAADSAAAGIDAWLVVDLPFEEAGEVRPALVEHGLHWIALVAPTTPRERLTRLLKEVGGFVYYITVTGVTGARNALPADIAARLEEVRALSPVPVVAGFGISSPDMAARVGRFADGIVVGSKVIDLLRSAPSPREGLAAVRDFVAGLRRALDAGIVPDNVR